MSFRVSFAVAMFFVCFQGTLAENHERGPAKVGPRSEQKADGKGLGRPSFVREHFEVPSWLPFRNIQCDENKIVLGERAKEPLSRWEFDRKLKRLIKRKIDYTPPKGEIVREATVSNDGSVAVIITEKPKGNKQSLTYRTMDLSKSPPIILSSWELPGKLGKVYFHKNSNDFLLFHRDPRWPAGKLMRGSIANGKKLQPLGAVGQIQPVSPDLKHVATKNQLFSTATLTAQHSEGIQYYKQVQFLGDGRIFVHGAQADPLLGSKYVAFTAEGKKKTDLALPLSLSHVMDPDGEFTISNDGESMIVRLSPSGWVIHEHPWDTRNKMIRRKVFRFMDPCQGGENFVVISQDAKSKKTSLTVVNLKQFKDFLTGVYSLTNMDDKLDLVGTLSKQQLGKMALSIPNTKANLGKIKDKIKEIDKRWDQGLKGFKAVVEEHLKVPKDKKFSLLDDDEFEVREAASKAILNKFKEVTEKDPALAHLLVEYIGQVRSRPGLSAEVRSNRLNAIEGAIESFIVTQQKTGKIGKSGYPVADLRILHQLVSQRPVKK